jgi:uncharacterized protein YycO
MDVTKNDEQPRRREGWSKGVRNVEVNRQRGKDNEIVSCCSAGRQQQEGEGCC